MRERLHWRHGNQAGKQAGRQERRKTRGVNYTVRQHRRNGHSGYTDTTSSYLLVGCLSLPTCGNKRLPCESTQGTDRAEPKQPTAHTRTTSTILMCPYAPRGLTEPSTRARQTNNNTAATKLLGNSGCYTGKTKENNDDTNSGARRQVKSTDSVDCLRAVSKVMIGLW